MKLFAYALTVLLYVYALFFALALSLAGFTLIRVSGYQWWSFALVILVPAALARATLAVMKGRTL